MDVNTTIRVFPALEGTLCSTCNDNAVVVIDYLEEFTRTFLCGLCEFTMYTSSGLDGEKIRIHIESGE